MISRLGLQKEIQEEKVNVYRLKNDRRRAAVRDIAYGRAPKLRQQMDRITRLPKPQQRFVMQVIDSVIAQAAR